MEGFRKLGVNESSYERKKNKLSLISFKMQAVVFYRLNFYIMYLSFPSGYDHNHDRFSHGKFIIDRENLKETYLLKFNVLFDSIL